MSALDKLNDPAAMARAGRLHTLRSARLDALHGLRDVLTRLNAGTHDDLALLAQARVHLDSLERVLQIEAQEYRP